MIENINPLIKTDMVMPRALKQMAKKKNIVKRKRRQRSLSQNKTTPGNRARQDLLLAAKHLFAERGLSATSIRDIANEAGVNSSLISYYFDGKEGLYRACIAEIGHHRLAMTQEILTPPESSEEYRLRLRMFIENMFGLFLDDRESGLLIIREYDRVDSPAEEIFKSTFLQVFELIHNFLSSAQKKGLIQKNKDTFTLAKLFFGCIFSQMRLDHINEKIYGKSIKNAAERRKVLDHILDLFLSAN